MPSSSPHVLLLSPGSKVALTRALAQAVEARGGTLSGWEADPLSPAAVHCTQIAGGECIESPDAAERLLAWCARSGVDLVVPSRHGDLPVLAAAADSFSKAGIAIVVSSPEAVSLCVDKIASHDWLARQGFPVPIQVGVAELAGSPLADQFPVVVKDARGSGSRQVRICRTAQQLADAPLSWIAQSLAPGTEYTVNTYVDRRGRCLCAIPHERMMVGDGEVVRGRTARISELMTLARRISETLPGARGPLNIQIFWETATRQATVIEINPRFGGGYPLAHEAGGRFTEWLLAERLDDAHLPVVEDWEAGLTMVRYREARFFRSSPG